MALSSVSSFAANVANRHLQKSNAGFSLALAKMSAGRRVLAAKNDAASLAIGSRLAAELRGLHQANVNAGQGSSMLQVADGGAANINDMLTRMKSLAVQAGSDHLNASDRAAINTEFQSLAAEIDRVSADTDFAGTALLDGSTGTVSFKVGTGTSPAADDISVSLGDLSGAALGLGGANVSSKAGADAAIAAIDGAIDNVQTFRAGVGASQNRLEFASANIASTIQSNEAARSQLIDLDIAAGMTELASNKTRFQAGLSMVSAANNQQKHILRLLV